MRKFQSRESLSVVMASYSIWLSTVCDVKKQKGQLLIVACESVKGLFHVTNIETA